MGLPPKIFLFHEETGKKLGTGRCEEIGFNPSMRELRDLRAFSRRFGASSVAIFALNTVVAGSSRRVTDRLHADCVSGGAHWPRSGQLGTCRLGRAVHVRMYAVAEWETSEDSSPLQCTDLRPFRNSPVESSRRFLHSFQSPDYPRLLRNFAQPKRVLGGSVWTQRQAERKKSELNGSPLPKS